MSIAKTVKARTTQMRAEKLRLPASKKERLIALLRAKDGKTIAELSAGMDWLPHSVHAALSGLRKSGAEIERVQQPNGPARYNLRAGAAK